MLVSYMYIFTGVRKPGRRHDLDRISTGFEYPYVNRLVLLGLREVAAYTPYA